MFNYKRRLLFLGTFLVTFFGIGCSTAPIANVNEPETNTNKSPYQVTFAEEARSTLNPLAKFDGYLPVNFDGPYVNREKRVEMYYFNVFKLREEETKDSFRVIFDLIDDALPEIPDRSPITLEVYNIPAYRSVRLWMDEHFKDPETNVAPQFSFEFVNSDSDSDFTVFDDKKSEKRFLSLYDKDTGHLLLFTMHHQNSRELLALGNTMLLQLTMIPQLDYGSITDTSDWQVYRNQEYGFEVRYPNDYRVSEGQGELPVYSVAFMHSSINPSLGGPAISIQVLDNPNQLSPAEFFDRDDENSSTENNTSFQSFPYLEGAHYYFSKFNDGRNILLQKGDIMIHFMINNLDQQKIFTVGNSIVKSFQTF